MRFGLFSSAQARRGNPDVRESAAGFNDYVEANVEAEALGFHSSFLVEHHFTGAGQVSDTLGLLAWVASRTKTLRIGTAVIVLPWHNPVLLAERVATLDLMSGGRLDLGIGKGYRHNEFSGFCMDPAEAEARFDEILAVMVKCWTSDERFSHRGPFWKFDDILVEPPTAQRPHPPLWIAAGSPATIKKVARLGARLLLDQFALPEQIRERIDLYRAELEAGGCTFRPEHVAVARNFFVAHSRAEQEAALGRRVQEHQRMVRLSQRPDGSNKAHILAYTEQPGGTEASALYGSAEEILGRLDELAKVGVRYILLNGSSDLRQSLRRFAKEVVPHIARPYDPASNPGRHAV